MQVIVWFASLFCYTWSEHRIAIELWTHPILSTFKCKSRDTSWSNTWALHALLTRCCFVPTEILCKTFAFVLEGDWSFLGRWCSPCICILVIWVTLSGLWAYDEYISPQNIFGTCEIWNIIFIVYSTCYNFGEGFVFIGFNNLKFSTI